MNNGKTVILNVSFSDRLSLNDPIHSLEIDFEPPHLWQSFQESLLTGSLPLLSMLNRLSTNIITDRF